MTTSAHSSPKVRYEADKGICTITLNQPERLNAIDKEMRWALAAAADRFEQDNSLGVLLLTGSDCGSFSTGSDIKASDLKDLAATFDDHISLVDGAGEAPLYADTVATVRKPVVAVIDGYCVGGGLELALGCDIRVATQRSSFGLPEARLGTLGDYGLDALSRTIPLGEALLIHLTGARMDGERAYQVGLVQALEPDRDALFIRAREIAEAILQCSPKAVRTIKHVVKTGRNLPIEYAKMFSQPFRDVVHTSPEAAEGALAFRDKRPANWVPRHSG